MKRAVRNAAAIALVFGGAAIAGQIHTWTDENGVLHMTDTPPPESAKTVETYRYRARPSRDLDAVQQIQAHEKIAGRIAEAEERAAEVRKRAEEATLRADDAEAVLKDEQRKLAEMVENATKRKKGALLIDRQKAVVEKAAELANEARRQANEAWTLAERASEQVDLIRTASQALDGRSQ
jgi:hypothetical protein